MYGTKVKPAQIMCLDVHMGGNLAADEIHSTYQKFSDALDCRVKCYQVSYIEPLMDVLVHLAFRYSVTCHA